MFFETSWIKISIIAALATFVSRKKSKNYEKKINKNFLNYSKIGVKVNIKLASVPCELYGFSSHYFA